MNKTTQNSILRKANLPHDAASEVANLLRLSKKLNFQLVELRAQRATIGDEIRRAAALDPKSRAEAIAKAASLKALIQPLEKELSLVEDALYRLAFSFPNDTHPAVPIGAESEARQIDLHVSPTAVEPETVDPRRDHVRIGTELEMLNFEAAATVSGNSFYYLVNDGAFLEMALINYAMKKAVDQGFKPVLTPDIVKSDISNRCGFVPRDGEASQNYHVKTGDDHPGQSWVLTGTAEIPLAGLFTQKVFAEADLPQLVVGLGRAFRAEAGARGADTRGLYRVHQFSKVELFAVSSAADGASDQMFERLVQVQRDILDGLGLTYK